MYEPDNPITQLVEYIKENLEKGYNLDALRYSLINQGYSKISVERAIDRANKKIAEKIPPIKEKPRITYKVIPIESEKPAESKESRVSEESEESEVSEDLELIEDEPEKKGFWKKMFE